jgi:fatty acid desaturase
MALADQETVHADAGVEWPTLALLTAIYGLWLMALFWIAPVSLWAAVPLLAWLGAQHSSLTHEALHGHPFRSPVVNATLLSFPLTVFVPYLRFKDLHLAHHRDEFLTDPYDDPESNFHDPAVWARTGWLMRAVWQAHNTLAGRILIGPVLGTWGFLKADWAMIRGGDRRVMLGWALHLPGLAVVLGLVWLSPMPVWAFGLATYGAFGLLRIRTFLEHRAHEKARGRSVVVEDRGPLALLFLNNNFHALHHCNPTVAWYRLPALYAARRDQVLARNDGYVFASYAQVFRRFLWRAKDPVPHPIWTPEQGVGQRRPQAD